MLTAAKLDQLADPLGHPEESRIVGHAAGLGQVVGDDDHGIAALQTQNQFFHHRRGHGIKSTTGFVHQQDFRLQHQGASDAEPLLLTTRQGQRRAVETIADFMPQAHIPERLFYFLRSQASIVYAVFFQWQLQIAPDRQGKRVRPLENHANAAAQSQIVNRVIDQVLPGKQDPACHSGLIVEFNQPVQGGNKTGFTASRRADEGGNTALVNIERYVREYDFGAIAHR